jgi:hypothetical protein
LLAYIPSISFCNLLLPNRSCHKLFSSGRLNHLNESSTHPLYRASGSLMRRCNILQDKRKCEARKPILLQEGLFWLDCIGLGNDSAAACAPHLH